MSSDLCFSYDVSSILSTHLSSCLETTLDLHSEEGVPLVKLAASVSETRQVSFYLVIIGLSYLLFLFLLHRPSVHDDTQYVIALYSPTS